MTKQKDRQQENKDDQKKRDSEQYDEESWKTLNVTTVFCLKFVLLMYIFFERRRRGGDFGHCCCALVKFSRKHLPKPYSIFIVRPIFQGKNFLAFFWRKRRRKK